MCAKSLLPSLWDRDAPDPFRSLHREIDRVFDSFNEAMPMALRAKDENGAWRLTPRVDVSETEGTLEVTAELPGVDEKDIDVTVAGDMLTIKGEKKSETESKEKDYHVVERSYGTFQRMVTLPCEVETDKIEAKFEQGVLKVTLPKSPESKAKTHKIKIKGA